MKKKFILFFLIIVFLSTLIIVVKNIKDNINNKKNQISFLKKNLSTKDLQLENIYSKLKKNNINLENIIFSEGLIFNKKNNIELKIGKTDYLFDEFYSSDIIFAKHPEASSSAYLESDSNHLFLITGTGQIAYTNKSSINGEKFKFMPIENNIQQLIKYEEFYRSSAYGVKDVLIHKNNIYISYIKEHYKDCFSTSIISGVLSTISINFSEFYSPKKCVDKNSKFYNDHEHDHFVPHQSGGRMIIFRDNIIFSTGEFRYRILAQDLNNDFGKILSINLENKDKKIISLGHRNPQGLYLDKKLNYLFSTEHGPSGGDEVNLIDLNKDTTLNFGWPISSYGKHYFDYDAKNDVRYKLSPLYKSHKKYGFEEPIKYFNPSVGISQIVGLSKNFNTSDYSSYLVGTMGTAKKLKEGMISLIFFQFDTIKKKIVDYELIPIKSRVRDIIYLEEEDLVLMYLENSNSIGILRRK